MPTTGTTARTRTAGARPAPQQFFCFVVQTQVTEAACAGFTRVVPRNRTFCCGNNCRSPWRECIACARQGDIRKDSVNVDDNGLCFAFHHKNGPDATRPKPGTPEPEPLGARGGNGTSPRGANPSPSPVPEPSAANTASLPTHVASGRKRRLATLPVHRIRPDPDQPRKWFNPAKLNELAKSMKEGGQYIDIIVRPVAGDSKHDYQIIGGERRWRAAGIAGVRNVECIVEEELADPKHIYAISFFENEAREGLSHLETAFALQRMTKEFGWALEDICRRRGKTTEWGYKHLSLLRLHIDIQAGIHPGCPRKKRISYSIAIDLTGIVDQSEQLKLYHEILRRRLSQQQAKRFIRDAIRSKGVETIRKRTPKSDYRIVTTFLRRTAEGARFTLELGRSLPSLFESRPSKDLSDVIKTVGDDIALLTNVRAALVHVAESRR